MLAICAAVTAQLCWPDYLGVACLLQAFLLHVLICGQSQAKVVHIGKAVD